MAIVKKRTEQIENSLLLEANKAVELPPAEVDESQVTLNFAQFELFVAELLAELRAGTIAEIIPVIKDGSTFQIHGRSKTFWVKIWHEADSEMKVIKRLQVLNCLPSMRNVKITFPSDEN